MTKSELRKAFLDKRKGLSASEFAVFNQNVIERFFNTSDLRAVENLHCYISIAKFNEIDTSLIYERIWHEFPQIRTIAPRIERESGELQSFVFDSETKFVEDVWGIREPADSELVDPKSLDLVVVPLLCFDTYGFRVGYGKGFYDRFLAKCRPDCLKVGMSFFPPVDRIDDTDDFDIPLNRCVTPDNVLNFGE